MSALWPNIDQRVAKMGASTTAVSTAASKPPAKEASKPQNTKEEKSEVADASGLLQTLQGHVEDIRALLQCGICVRPLYEPYTLACGHTFCYGCLTSWFSSGRSHKTCPDCRAQVKVQPAPAYLVRTIVQLFTGHAELLEKDETTAEHLKSQREEAERLEKDKSNVDPRTGGLFQGFFKPKLHPGGPIYDAEDGVARCPNCAWELEEDSCLNCGYHVEDGTVSSVSDYSDDFSDMTDDDGEDDEEEMGDADGFADYDGAWVDEYPHPLPFTFQQIYGAAQRIGPQHNHHNHNHNHNHHHHYNHNTFPYNQFLSHPIFRRPLPNPTFHDEPTSSVAHSSENESEEEEEDEDEDMDSFIDDSEPQIYGSDSGSNTDHSTVVGDHDYMQDDEDGGDDSVTITSVGTPFYHPLDVGRSREVESLGDGTSVGYWTTDDDHDEENYDDDDDDGEEDDNNDNDDDEEDDEDEPIRSFGAIRHRRTGQQPPYSQTSRSATRRPGAPSLGSATSSAAGASASNAINIDDDSEDEMPVPAVSRRSRLSRR